MKSFRACVVNSQMKIKQFVGQTVTCIAVTVEQIFVVNNVRK